MLSDRPTMYMRGFVSMSGVAIPADLLCMRILWHEFTRNRLRYVRGIESSFAFKDIY